MHQAQRTVARRIDCVGIGLHSGRNVNMTILPAGADTGVTFVRTDLDGQPAIAARPDTVVDATLSTTIGQGQARVGTIEHLMAALAGTGIDNARILLDAPEVPVMDGSAAPFIFLLRKAGSKVLRRPKRYLVVQEPLAVEDNDRHIRITPSDRFSINCSIDFDHPLMSRQSFELDFSDQSFVREISRARTFGFLKDVELMKKNGLALGGSLDNAIVLDDYRVLNEDGLRYPNEFVRHKLLDFIGDLALLGHPVIGHFEVHKAGHALNHQLVRRIQGSADVVEADLTAPAQGIAGRPAVQAPSFALLEAVA